MSAGPSTEGRSPVAGALGEGLRIAFARMHVFLPIALLVRLVPPAACSSWLEFSGSPDSVDAPLALRSSVLLGAGSLFLTPLLTSALLAKAVLRYRRRDPMRLRSILAAGLRGAFAPVAISAVLAISLSVVLPMIKVRFFGEILLSLVSGLSLLVGYLFVVARVAVAAVAAAEERLSVQAALRRGWQLTQGKSWRVMGVAFTLLLLWLVLFRGFLGALLRLLLMRLDSGKPHERYWFGFELPSAAGDAVFGAIVASVAVTLFARLRAQRDGLSIEELEKTFD